jgi:hypothetical protein
MATKPTFFLLFRRGIPLLGIAVSLAAIALHPASLGWALMASIALVAELGTTFHAGKLYLSKRQAIILWDGYWLKILRPFFRLINMEEAWLRSFCEWNNQRVMRAFRGKPKRKAMVLLPHCIQATKCKAPVVNSLQSCLKCGKCVVEDAAQEAAKRNWDVKISPRSRAAYIEARKFHPDIIIAIACTDRLVKGLIKLPEIPSFTIPLDLPHGMCVDTTFDFQRLLQVMDAFAETRSRPNIQPLKISGGDD